MLSGKLNVVKKSPEDIKFEIEKRNTEIKNQLIHIQNYKLNKNRIYESVIPLKIYQTWHTKNLPPLMKYNVEKLKRSHPRFEHFLFDDNDCREFIKNNFDAQVLNAFDNLIPGAFKADLWRYCILYINGGIYLDIKYSSVNHFRFIELTEKEHWVLDIDKNNIYNALIVSKPNNPILLNCINKVVENVKNKFYGSSCVDPTGPGLVKLFLSKDDKARIEMEHLWTRPTGDKFIIYKNISILKMYNNYYTEQNIYKKVAHYTELWSKQKVYK